MRFTVRTILVSIALLMAMPLATAGDREQRRAEILEQFDTDGDGQLSEAERQAARESGAFSGRSGKRGRGGKRRQEILEEFDADGDGQLSEAERQAARDSGKFGRRGRHPDGDNES